MSGLDPCKVSPIYLEKQANTNTSYYIIIPITHIVLHGVLYTGQTLKKVLYILRRQVAVIPDQLDNLLQYLVFLPVGKSGRICLCNKGTDVSVNTIPAARYDVLIHNVQSIIVCHITNACLANIVQNHVEVNNVTHQASNNLLSGKHESDWAVTILSRCSLTCLHMLRKPNPQPRLQMQSGHDYRQFNSTR
jgi:hypothetical protein